MLNQVVLVGRLTKDPKLEENTIITLAVPRTYKNEEGMYDTDFIDCILKGQIATNTVNYCKKGDIIGVKGRIETNNVEKFHTKVKETQIIAEKVTFLSSKKD